MKNIIISAMLAIGMLGAINTASANDVSCGVNNGQKATGEPIKVGGIYGNAPPGDFSSATDAAAAYFKCVNDNGGVHGRPIQYMLENDQWNPELAAQAAAKLVQDEGVIAMIANSSFIESSVNAPFYAENNIIAMSGGCAVSECAESSNIISTLQGPLASSTGAAMYAVEELGATNIVCIGVAIPSVGNWSCGAVNDYMASKGLTGSFVLLNPASPDVNSALLEAISSGADSILVNLPAGLAIAFMNAAEEQGIVESYTWTSSTPLYDASVPKAVGDIWDGNIFISAELTRIDGEGPDNQNWLKVMDAYGRAEDPRDTFSQGGYLAARYFVDTLRAMDPSKIDDRDAVTEAIVAINGYTSDLSCGPYYVGKADRHLPNHAGIMVKISGDGFEEVRGCFEYEGPYFDEIIATEKALGLRK